MDEDGPDVSEAIPPKSLLDNKLSFVSAWSAGLNWVKLLERLE